MWIYLFLRSSFLPGLASNLYRIMLLPKFYSLTSVYLSNSGHLAWNLFSRYSFNTFSYKRKKKQKQRRKVLGYEIQMTLILSHFLFGLVLYLSFYDDWQLLICLSLLVHLSCTGRTKILLEQLVMLVWIHILELVSESLVLGEGVLNCLKNRSPTNISLFNCLQSRVEGMIWNPLAMY